MCDVLCNLTPETFLFSIRSDVLSDGVTYIIFCQFCLYINTLFKPELFFKHLLNHCPFCKGKTFPGRVDEKGHSRLYELHVASYGVMNMDVILGNHKQFIWLTRKYVGEKGWKTSEGADGAQTEEYGLGAVGNGSYQRVLSKTVSDRIY